MSKTRFDRSQFIMMFFAFSLGMVLSNLLGQSKAESKEPVAEILFTYKGVDKTTEDVSHTIREKLSQLAMQRYGLLERAALEQYLYDYAALENLDLTQAGKKLFQIEAPSEKEVSDFFTQNMDKINKPFFEVKSDIKKQLMILKAAQAKKTALDNLTARGDLLILPERQANDHSETTAIISAQAAAQSSAPD